MEKIDLEGAKDSIDTTIPVLNGEVEENWGKAEHDAEMQRIHLNGLQSFYKLRTKWSWFILCCIGSLLIFQGVLLGLVGAGKWAFDTWVMPTVITEYFIQIIGLAIIVVKFLFNEK